MIAVMVVGLTKPNQTDAYHLMFSLSSDPSVEDVGLHSPWWEYHCTSATYVSELDPLAPEQFTSAAPVTRLASVIGLCPEVRVFFSFASYRLFRILITVDAVSHFSSFATMLST